jgi:hypothetical protein
MLLLIVINRGCSGIACYCGSEAIQGYCQCATVSSQFEKGIKEIDQFKSFGI